MSKPFKLGTFGSRDGEIFAGFVFDDAGPVYKISQALAIAGATADRRSIREFLDDWQPAFKSVSSIADKVGGDERRFAAAATPLAELRVYPPVNPPGELFQAGANYRSHVWQLDCAMRINKGEDPAVVRSAESRQQYEARMDNRISKDPPVLFNGVRNTIVGAYDDVILPSRFNDKPDWELELGLVFGKAARYVEPEKAYDYVAGYVMCNDVSHREMIKRIFPVGSSWLEMKNSPTFTPTGPYLVPAQFVEDPMKLQIVLKLNGEIMQNESTSDMLYDIPKIIAFLSKVTVVKPGDMLITGSPSGNGMHHGRFLRDGDVMEGSVTGLGVQRNKVVQEAV